MDKEQLPLGAWITMPHCDTTILHAPGKCRYCDMHPDWQQYRIQSRISFSDEHFNVTISGKAPCPSTWFRNSETRDMWHGNLPISEAIIELP